MDSIQGGKPISIIPTSNKYKDPLIKTVVYFIIDNVIYKKIRVLCSVIEVEQYLSSKNVL